ncbi:diacylglycerol kinase (ATP) [Luteibacter sp. UNC138MFCol5.1]|nr:diacylglycerol kinase (ATP) [Luteibacter sp. UNC138MFCol5.1]
MIRAVSRARIRSDAAPHPLPHRQAPLPGVRLGGLTGMASTERRGPRQIYAAFRWSMQGLRACFRHEASFRLEVLLAIVVVPLGLWLGQGAIEKIVLITFPMLVLSAELLNSAIEAVVDKVSPEFHELAGRAKDMGSAAVFLLMMMVLVSWALILGPRLLG